MMADIIYFYPHIAQATLNGVVAMSFCTDVTEAVATRLVSVVSARMDSMDPATFLSFLATLLTGHGSHVPQPAPQSYPARHAALTAAACQALMAIGDSGEFDGRSTDGPM